MNFLPGWEPSIGGLELLTELAFQASATSTSETITGPASIQSGDVLVLLDRASNFTGSPPTSVVPSGFTTINDSEESAQKQILSMKIADGSEASASLTGMNGTFSNRKSLGVFRGDIAAKIISALDVAAEAVDTNPTQQTVNASGGSAPLLVIGCYGSNSAVDPRTFSTTADGEINPDTALYLAYKIYNSAPADTNIDMDDEGTSNILQSCYIEVS